MKRTQAIALLTLAFVSPAVAGFTVFEQDFSGWSGASGPYNAITFQGFPDGTPMTDQYSSLGVSFTGFDLNSVAGPSWTVFPQDAWGLDGNSLIELTFAQPISAIGWHFPGHKAVKFYSGNTLVWSDVHIGQAGQVDNFTGFIGDVTFDRVRMTGVTPSDDNVVIDNIYFSTIPGPAGISLGAVAIAFGRSRRRR